MRKSRIIIYFLLVIIITLFNFYFRPVEGNPLITEEYKKSTSYVNDIYMSNDYFKNSLITSEEKERVFNQIFNDIKSGKTSTNIKCESNCVNYLNDVYEIIYLDHPELIGFQSISWHYSNPTDVEVKYITLDSVRTYLGAKRIERELDIVKNETKNMTEKEKIIFVYDYIASHNYDHMFTYTSSNQSAYSFFTKKSSVCAGFAKAAQLVFQNIGIESYGVLNTDHMWNYVKYEDKYYVFDATVGASYSDKSNDNYYEGLGRTTVGVTTGNHPELYPQIESTPLKEIFGL